MKEAIEKVWKDPVRSKVIASAVVGGLLALWGIFNYGSGWRF